MRALVLTAILVFLVSCSNGTKDAVKNGTEDEIRDPATTQVDESWGHFFGDKRAKGCFVLRELGTRKTRAFNLERAQLPLLPASTFKIPNTLIALDSNVVGGRNHVFRWDGNKRRMKSWERDHDLTSAYRNSVVPVYQEIARAVGEEQMASYVKGFGYGNQDVSGGIDRFWLDGNLRISAVEQLDFLEKLYFETLPARKRSQRIVKEIMLYEETSRFVIRAKSGWALRVVDPIGWWVGWVEVDDRAYAFALNMEMKLMKNANRRIDIAKSILRAEGLLPD